MSEIKIDVKEQGTQKNQKQQKNQNQKQLENQKSSTSKPSGRSNNPGQFSRAVRDQARASIQDRRALSKAPRLPKSGRMFGRLASLIHTVAFALMCPEKGAALQWNDEYANDETGKERLHAETDVDWSQAAIGEGSEMLGMPENESIIFTLWSMLCWSIIYFANEAGQSCIYTFFMSDTADNVDDVPIPNFPLPQTVSDSGIAEWFTMWMPYSTFTAPNDAFHKAFHGSTWFAGRTELCPGMSFFWADGAGDSNPAFVTFVITGLTNSSENDIWFQLSTWEPGKVAHGAAYVQAVWSSENSNYECQFSIGQRCYWGLSYYSTVDLPGVTVKYACSNAMFGHQCAPAFDANAVSCMGVRMMGQSLMYSNTASELDNGGTVVGCQVPPSIWWFNLAMGGSQGDAYTFVNTMPNKYIPPQRIKRGIYGFRKTATPFDFDMKEVVASNGTVLANAGWDLQAATAYLVVVPRVNDPTNRQGVYVTAQQAEELSTNPWLDPELPFIPQEAFEGAMKIVHEASQWSSNDDHIKKITSAMIEAAPKALDAILKYGPEIAEMAAAL